jgi:hypothetical protein
MNTPQNFSGQMTEEIMRAFSTGHKNQIVKLENGDYNKIYSHIYKTLESIGLSKKMEEQYLAVNEYKSFMQEKYKDTTDWFENKYPEGLYTKKAGMEVGVNIITKKFIAEMLEINELSKKK